MDQDPKGKVRGAICCFSISGWRDAEKRCAIVQVKSRQLRVLGLTPLVFCHKLLNPIYHRNPNPKPVDHSRHPGDAEDEGGFIQVDNGERGGPTMWLISLLHGNRLELPSRARISGGCDVSTGTIWPEVRVGASRIAATPFLELLSLQPSAGNSIIRIVVWTRYASACANRNLIPADRPSVFSNSHSERRRCDQPPSSGPVGTLVWNERRCQRERARRSWPRLRRRAQGKLVD